MGKFFNLNPNTIYYIRAFVQNMVGLVSIYGIINKTQTKLLECAIFKKPA